MTTFRIDMQFVPPTWTPVTDVLATETLSAKRGQTTGTPTPIDRVADPGTCAFGLRNDAGNSGAKLGYYSPKNTNCRAGFAYGVPTRLVVNTGADHVIWTGKLRVIDPDPGTKRARMTHCTAQDVAGDLTEAQVRAIPPQIDQTEVQLLQAILDALSVDALPPATSFDSALDSYPFAFDQIGDGALAIGLVNDVAVSCFGYVYQTADGTLVYENRHTRALKTSTFTLNADTDGDDVVVPSSLANVYNRIRVIEHPKTEVPNVVLYAQSGAIAVAPGQTVTVWGTYGDFANDNAARVVGGKDFTTPPVAATTDYLGNAVDDGSGADLTSLLTVTATPFASTVEFEISTSALVTVYVTFLQLQGTAIYDNAPQTVESFVAKDYGDRPIDIDLTFQNDPAVAQDLADYVQVLYNENNTPTSVQIKPLRSAALMTQAVTREIGDVITLSETVTGLSSVMVAIIGIEWEISNNLECVVTWYLAPQATAHLFVLDDAIFGVLDSPAAVLGYA